MAASFPTCQRESASWLHHGYPPATFAEVPGQAQRKERLARVRQLAAKWSGVEVGRRAALPVVPG